MVRTFEGRFEGRPHTFGIVVSRFNDTVTTRLYEGAVDTLLRHGVLEENIHVAWVPGAFEIPVTAQRMAARGGYSALLCLGAVIRGQTPHFEHVAGQSAAGVARVALRSGIPVIYAILTTDTVEQAFERSGIKSGNKGHDAAMSALEMASLFQQLCDPAGPGAGVGAGDGAPAPAPAMRRARRSGAPSRRS